MKLKFFGLTLLASMSAGVILGQSPKLTNEQVAEIKQAAQSGNTAAVASMAAQSPEAATAIAQTAA